MMDKLMRSLRPRRVAVTATAPVARRERVERLLMGVVMIGSVVQLVAGNSYDQSQKLTACDTGVHNCYQTRQIAPNMWGLIVTLVSLTTDAWGFASSSEFAWRLLLVFVAGPIMPVWSLIEVLGKAFVGMTLTSKLGRSTLTVAKSNSANIIAQCDVLLGMSEDAATRFPLMHTEQNYTIDVLLTPLEVGNRRESEALVLLNDRGKEALLRSNVLPKYEQLRFLQGYSGLAIAVSAAQATGYIFGVISRASQALNVTPIERICMALSFIVLVKAGLYTIASSCHHPLLLHVPPEHEESVLEACKDTKYDERDELIVELKTLLCTELVFALLLSLSIVAIWHIIQVTFFDSLPSFFFAIGLFLQMIIALLMFGKSVRIPSMLRTKFCSISIVALCSVVNVAAYSLAVVATVKNWHASGFSFQSHLSSSLPHIG
ncbi:uncharacterized protein [Physcomitrium patens]|uniref:Uncharacterized protein n=1 Tax=Physcomitrium patens TaxID=3218 RepID=A0A2K1JUU5_PHYPA|nr:uncharacterized protein LOC112288162 [Physcomitrium patens]PNR45303.1 hypothetical protein PHYPA_015074 [Physcomitrium patens]|eukprot:XP_024387820.1 uncharacterized protein LOC112288162 [Physcomitrella patens]